MADITLDGLPAKVGTIDDAAVLHLKEGGVDKKLTIAALLAKISAVYSAFINSLLATTTAFDARDVLAIDRRTTVSNADYTILNTDRVVAQIGTMSAAHTFTLPPASTFRAGGELFVIDESGSVTPTNKITISRAAADTIDGATSFDIIAAYGVLQLISDGIDSWKVSNNNAPASLLETIAGVINNKFVSPSTLAGLFSNGNISPTSGYGVIPMLNASGAFVKLYIQWGRSSTSISAGGGILDIAFPATFPNDVYYSSAQVISAGTNNQLTIPFVEPTSLSNLRITNFDVDSPITGLTWFAVGF